MGMVTAERVVVLLLEVLAAVGYKCNNCLLNVNESLLGHQTHECVLFQRVILLKSL